jgi:hypothetical protein
MRLLWTLTKLFIALAIVLPLAIIALSTALGVLGALAGLAFFALRVGIGLLLLYGLIKLTIALVGGNSAPKRAPVRDLPPPAPVDPYVEAARRELDREIPG